MQLNGGKPAAEWLKQDNPFYKEVTISDSLYRIYDQMGR